MTTLPTRIHEVQVTREYSGGDPVWTNAQTYTVPEGTDTIAIPALGSTDYSVRTRVQDVYGNYSEWSPVVDHTTTSGADALLAEVATVATEAEALDHAITETEIDDLAISTPKLQANAVTTAKVTAGAITASKLDIGASPSDNLFPDPLMDWAGIGDTSGWDSIGSAFNVEAVNGATSFKRGPYRIRMATSGATTTLLRSTYIPVNGITTAASYITVGFEHGLSYTSGTVIHAVYYYDSSLSLLGSATLGTWSAGVTWPTQSVYRLKPNGKADPTEGTTIDDEMPADTCYIRLAWDDNGSATTMTWYLTQFGVWRGLIPHFSAGVGEGWDEDYSSVVVVPHGVIIRNGRLAFDDKFADTVLDGGGFSSNWLDFIRSGGIYNSRFNSGSTSDMAVTESSDGDSVTDYAASLSANLPYWVVAASGGTLSLVADTAASSGKALKSASTGSAQTNRIYQDIPLGADSVDDTMLINFAMKTVAKPSGTITVNLYASYRTSAHALIGSRVKYAAGTLGFAMADYADLLSCIVTGDFTLTTGNGWLKTADLSRPSNAYYLRWELEVVHSATSQEVRFDDLTIQTGYLNLDTLQVETLSTSGLTGTGGLYADGTSILANSPLVASAEVEMQSGTFIEGTLSPAALTGATNNWNPTGLAYANAIRMDSDGAYTLSGIVAHATIAGQTIVLSNISAYRMTLANDATSTAANRFLCPGGRDYILEPDGSVVLWYDSDSSRWRFSEAHGGWGDVRLWAANRVVNSAFTSTSAATIIGGPITSLNLTDTFRITLTGVISFRSANPADTLTFTFTDNAGTALATIVVTPPVSTAISNKAFKLVVDFRLATRSATVGNARGEMILYEAATSNNEYALNVSAKSFSSGNTLDSTGFDVKMAYSASNASNTMTVRTATYEHLVG